MVADGGPDWRLRDLFSVRRGIATGANDFFVLARAEASRLGIPEIALRPLLPKARMLTTDIIDSEKDGYPALRPQLCLLDCDLPEVDVRKRFPKLMAYLDTAKGLGIRERNLLRSRNPWYRQERRKPAPFLCTYMGRPASNGPPLHFIWNKSEAVVTNTYLMLYPRPALAKLLADQPQIYAKLFALLRETAQTTMSEFLRIHAGGLRKIEPKDLQQVRLPKHPTWLKKIIGATLEFE